MRSKTSTQMQNRVLAIDPGFDRVGVAVMKSGNVLYSHCIETDRKSPHEERLLTIGSEVRKVIKKWEPNTLAIEQIFFNQNTTNAMKVSEARGVIIYEAALARLEVKEYSPQAIKIAVTGYGKASKDQVTGMVQKLVKLKNKPKKRLDDELDAIALGITHLASQRAI